MLHRDGPIHCRSRSSRTGTYDTPHVEVKWPSTEHRGRVTVLWRRGAGQTCTSRCEKICVSRSKQPIGLIFAEECSIHLAINCPEKTSAINCMDQEMHIFPYRKVHIRPAPRRPTKFCPYQDPCNELPWFCLGMKHLNSTTFSSKNQDNRMHVSGDSYYFRLAKCMFVVHLVVQRVIGPNSVPSYRLSWFLLENLSFI